MVILMVPTDSRFVRLSLALVAMSVLVLYVWAAAGLSVAGPQPAGPPVASDVKPRGITLAAADAASLVSKFAELDYSLNDVRRGHQEVPRVFLTSLPSDLQEVHSVHQRKRLFIKALLPLILQANEEILTQRRRLLALAVRKGLGEDLTRPQERWLVALARNYGVRSGDLEALIQRVDMIPPSLALAQSAAESGWGTSRFAVDGNAVFGQHTYRQGTGLVPERRDDGRTHEVKIFGGLKQSVVTYMKNLNTHWAYEEFRAERVALRQQRTYLDGFALAGTLHIYSERGGDYIETIRDIIRINALDEFDRSRLGDTDLDASPQV